MPLSIAVDQGPDCCVIRVEGEVDLYTSPELRNHILTALRTCNGLQLDLARVAYMDSSGVATLVEGLKSASKANRRFQLVAPSNAVTKVLQLSRLDSLFDVVPDESAPA
jgi:anti-sigma B factor antagonist